MDVASPVESSLLIVTCPHCGDVEEDGFECVDDNRVQIARCVSCAQSFHFVAFECLHCCAETVFTWLSHPEPDPSAKLACPKCGSWYGDHEAPDSSFDLLA